MFNEVQGNVFCDSMESDVFTVTSFGDSIFIPAIHEQWAVMYVKCQGRNFEMRCVDLHAELKYTSHFIFSRQSSQLFFISSFRREVAEKCAVLGYCAASSGNFLPTFRDNLSVPSSR